MTFARDILLMDFEGFEAPKQVGVILLDQESLKEKDAFVSYIHADLHGRPSTVSGITQEMLADAPKQSMVGRTIFERFGTQVLLASFVSDLDMRHFKTLMRAACIDETLYDYHVLDIWPIAYTHLLKKGYEGGLNSEDIFQAFGAPPRGLHDALADCRITADVLRACMRG